MPANDDENKAFVSLREGVPLGMAVLLVGCLALGGVSAGKFTPDSWAYWELSRTFGEDFYRFTTWRAFLDTNPYSRSFPPLWPALIHVTDQLTHLRIYSGYALAFALMAVFSLLSEQISRCLFGVRWAGLIAALTLLTYRPLYEETLAARAIPLQLVLIALMMLTLHTTRISSGVRAILLGVLCGCLVLNRFDGLIMAGVMILALPVLGYRLTHTLWAAAAFALTLSPWIAYSLNHFGVLLASDNSGVALSADPTRYVTDYLVSTGPTLFTHPLDWLRKVLVNAGMLGVFATKHFMLSLMPLLVLTAAILLWKRRQPATPTRTARIKNLCCSQGTKILMVAVSGALLALAAQIVTGYLTPRYLSLLFWLIALTLLVLILKIKPRLSLPLAATCTVLLMAVTIVNGQLRLPVIPAQTQGEGDFSPLLACLKDAGATPDKTLMITDPTQAARFGALTGWRSAMLPNNWHRLDAETARGFTQKFGIRYVLAMPPMTALPHLTLQPMPQGCRYGPFPVLAITP